MVNHYWHQAVSILILIFQHQWHRLRSATVPHSIQLHMKWWLKIALVRTVQALRYLCTRCQLCKAHHFCHNTNTHTHNTRCCRNLSVRERRVPASNSSRHESLFLCGTSMLLKALWRPLYARLTANQSQMCVGLKMADQ